MKTGRLEAFSDGVFAILITIMVLELKVPHDTTFNALLSVAPTFISYLLSFIYLGIYWNNHHHLLYAFNAKVKANILWANLHLLFWLSLIPFATAWVGEHHIAALPIALYGFILFMSSIAYRILEIALIRLEPDNAVLKKEVKSGIKEGISTLFYLIAIPFSFYNTWVSIVCYTIVAAIWIIPHKKLEDSI